MAKDSTNAHSRASERQREKERANKIKLEPNTHVHFTLNFFKVTRYCFDRSVFLLLLLLSSLLFCKLLFYYIVDILLVFCFLICSAVAVVYSLPSRILFMLRYVYQYNVFYTYFGCGLFCCCCCCYWWDVCVILLWYWFHSRYNIVANTSSIECSHSIKIKTKACERKKVQNKISTKSLASWRNC